MAADLLRLSLSPNFPPVDHRKLIRRPHSHSLSLSFLPRRRLLALPPGGSFRRNPNPSLTVSKAFEVESPAGSSSPSSSEKKKPVDTSFVFDVNGMVCSVCVSRVKGILFSDERVDSAVVNALTETAAVRLKPAARGADDSTAEDLARKLTESGFRARRRVVGSGVGERMRRWREMAAKKEELLEKSRNRVVLAWILVALCCSSHGSHLLHSLGIHIAHGGIWDVLHNSYVKGALALGALLGPGRDVCRFALQWCPGTCEGIPKYEFSCRIWICCCIHLKHGVTFRPWTRMEHCIL